MIRQKYKESLIIDCKGNNAIGGTKESSSDRTKKDSLTLTNRKKTLIEKGKKIKYIGETNSVYENGKIYEVYGYDDELEAYGVLSDLGEVYLVAPDDLEEIPE